MLALSVMIKSSSLAYFFAGIVAIPLLITAFTLLSDQYFVFLLLLVLLTILPVGHDRSVTRRLPIITLGLIFLNVAIFLLVNYVNEGKDELFEKNFVQLVNFRDEHPDLKITEDANFRLNMVSSEYFKYAKSEEAKNIKTKPTELLNIKLNSSDIDQVNQLQMDSLCKNFVSAYDANLYIKYSYIPAFHKEQYSNQFSSMFMHASISHLLGNMLILLLIGMAIEDIWGGIVFLLIYFSAGFFAIVAQTLSNPDSKSLNLGASGAIAGLMGAFLIRYFKSKLKILFLLKVFRVPTFVALPFWIISQLVQVVDPSAVARDGIAYWAHIGGFFTGTILATLIYFTKIEKYLLPNKSNPAKSFSTKHAVEEAGQDIKDGDTNQAIAKLKLRNKEQPGDYDAYNLLVQLYKQTNQRSLEVITTYRFIEYSLASQNNIIALDEYRKLLATFSEKESQGRLPLKLWVDIANTFKSYGRHQEAVSEYEKIYRFYPHDKSIPHVLVNAAESYLHLSEVETARQLYIAARKLVLDNNDPLFKKIQDGHHKITGIYF